MAYFQYVIHTIVHQRLVNTLLVFKGSHHTAGGICDVNTACIASYLDVVSFVAQDIINAIAVNDIVSCFLIIP